MNTYCKNHRLGDHEKSTTTYTYLLTNERLIKERQLAESLKVMIDGYKEAKLDANPLTSCLYLKRFKVFAILCRRSNGLCA